MWFARQNACLLVESAPPSPSRRRLRRKSLSRQTNPPQPNPQPKPPGRLPRSLAKPAKPVPEGEPIKMPFGDLTISEGKLVRWLKQPGDQVSASEVVAEIETEKAILEIESPRNGILSEFLSDAGSMVKMGETIAVVKSA